MKLYNNPAVELLKLMPFIIAGFIIYLHVSNVDIFQVLRSM